MKYISGARMLRRYLPTLAIACACLSPAYAQQDFTLALSTPPTSLDPHFQAFTPNVVIAEHMFDALIKVDPAGKLIPGLAESWKLVNNLTWEFKLRKGVKFHDGSDFTADDVVWSLDRPATIVGSPTLFTAFTKGIVNKAVVDPHTIRITTSGPYPLLISDMSAIAIVSKSATQNLKSNDFATGKGLVGTGPFKFAKFLRNDRIILERNDSYWGPKPAWNSVAIRFISNNSTRLAALLAGDVHAIEDVPTPDMASVRANPKLNLFSTVSHRVVYVFLDFRDKSPHVTDASGKILDVNPMKDIRVRTALSMAINREAIKDHVMEGLAKPASNLVPEGYFGYNPAIKAIRYDPEGAKKLLAQAGYPKGFDLKIHTTNNRLVNDEKVAQTIAQMWSKIGVHTLVEAQPAAIFFPALSRGVYSAGLSGFGASTGESSFTYRSLVACVNKEKGLGVFNRSHYCNPKMDAILLNAMSTIPENDRRKLLQDVALEQANDIGVIPVHHQVSTWATKKGIKFTARGDERTHAYAFRPE